MKNIIDNSYKSQGDSEVITTGYRITGKMDNNPDFADAPPELAEATQLLPEFVDSVIDAKRRDIEDINLKNVRKARLIVLLTILAKYVTEKSKGDRGIILSSGFLVSGDKSNEEEPVIEQPLKIASDVSREKIPAFKKWFDR